MSVIRYDESMASDWDKFIFEKAVNGNFLQSRRFLSYHPENRFQDCSLMCFDSKNNLRAIVPAALRCDDGGRHFVSHPGSTYGGIVIDAKSCSAKRLQVIVEDIVNWCEANDFSSIELKFPPDFMWTRNECSLIEYMLYFNGFSERVELTTYVDFSQYKERTVSNFSQGKRTNVNNGIKKGLTCRELGTDEEITSFYDTLCKNLAKHNVRPVHTLEELRRLHFDNLCGSSVMLGVFYEEELLAAGWLFLFQNQGVAHTQYLCSSSEYDALSPMTFLYYSVIEYCKSRGFNYLSWGVSTEEHGAILNWGLTESKEHFGSLHGVHRTFVKQLAC